MCCVYVCASKLYHKCIVCMCTVFLCVVFSCSFVVNVGVYVLYVCIYDSFVFFPYILTKRKRNVSSVENTASN